MLVGRVHQQEKKRNWILQKLLKKRVYVLDAFVFQTVYMKFVLKILCFDDALYTVIPIC